MPIIPVTNISVKKAMSYVVGKQHGYMKELEPYGKETIEGMKVVGFLRLGCTQEVETFKATRLLKKFYINTFGKTEYIKQRLVSTFKNKHLK